MDPLNIDTWQTESELRFVLQGEVDLASAPALQEALEAALAGPNLDLVVDVSEVHFLDCTAVGILLQICGKAEPQGRRLRVTGATGMVLQVMETAGVAKRLGVYESAGHWQSDDESTSDELLAFLLDTMSQLPTGVRERDQLRDRVVTAGTPLAHALARRFTHRGEPFDDLYQVAMVGLLKAVDGYNPHRGREFVAYAKPTILGELRRHFRDRTWSMSVPRRHKEMRLALNGARDELAQRLGHSPSVAELAEHLQTSTEEVLGAIEAAQAYQSVPLSTPVGEDEGVTLADMVGSDDPDLEAVENRAALPVLIGKLPEREQRILTMRFYGNMTQSQIADSTGVSQMHVSRLLRASLDRLREELFKEEVG
ncbi:SigB/SigF/SigG family RNA polymerase sigma factor [Natronosporangium hydrolyticum]|uniref:Anti-sigma factor antagonist n=1 Tax=Natronosporangium hydrolyticum TaxID=2811111 RepID=A0A895YDV8_9ACTN|nr:SigB/SigF/SigG family RNA polymerase sigma factor [Natronosporangium hydrolyticum]QSB12736.1 SigB/SigF/SigG family RNA polymerase sigma factor [Natronosporangium hydrolyticum]